MRFYKFISVPPEVPCCPKHIHQALQTITLIVFTFQKLISYTFYNLRTYRAWFIQLMMVCCREYYNLCPHVFPVFGQTIWPHIAANARSPSIRMYIPNIHIKSGYKAFGLFEMPQFHLHKERSAPVQKQGLHR